MCFKQMLNIVGPWFHPVISVSSRVAQKYQAQKLSLIEEFTMIVPRDSLMFAHAISEGTVA